VFLLARKTSELSPADIELIQEAAGALARCGARLEEALGKLRSAETVLDLCSVSRLRHTTPTKTGPEAGLSRQEALEQYRKAWKEAEKARYVYIVQREAVGFRNHRFADRIYPLPALRNPST
jgi:hypothetical protein